MLDNLSEQFLAEMDVHRDSLWRFVRSMVRTQHEAEDVVSETVLQAYERFGSLRDSRAFVSFLFTIASRTVKRRRWKRRFFDEYDQETAEQMHADGIQGDVHTDVEILRTALQRLPQKMREAIVMFEINGLSIEEIKEIQGGTLSGVKSRLKRGREQLTKILTDSERVAVQMPSSSTQHPSRIAHPRTVL